MSHTIPFLDLTRIRAHIKKELDAVIHRVITRGVFILGSEVSAFEKEFAAYIGVPYAVGVASGTDALTLSLQAFGIGPGDEVILPANAYPTAFGVAKSGARIRLADVDEQTGLISVGEVKKAITRRTRTIIPVHLYGHPVPMKELLRLTMNDERLTIIEDAAQAHGAAINTKKVGRFGDIAIFSFYPSKNLGAFGDGGMIVTNSKALRNKLKQFRMYGETDRYKSSFVAGVSRLDELQAAILRVKLRHLDEGNKKRTAIAKKYLTDLAGVGDLRFLRPQQIGHVSANHLFVIRTGKRNALQKYLASHGVATAIHYPAPIHTQKAFRHLAYKKGDFPVSEALSREVLSLPMFPYLTTQELERIVRAVRSFFHA